MPFVKIVKNKAYFKRFQVKYRRRREGKTDYRARRQMVLQDKTKYGAPKYRLVARVTNKDIVAQIIHAQVDGDKVLAFAYSHELPQFGVKFGLTNYAAAYATGLLLARRTLTKLKIADKFLGVVKPTGAFVAGREKGDGSEDRYPFKAILDIGLARTTTGARIFGVMKGAVDGGIAVPHKPNRFPGFKKAKGELDAKAHRERIFGAHVANYLKIVEEKVKSHPDEKFTQFSRFINAGIKPADVEGLYAKAHEAIRKDPTKRAAPKTDPKKAAESRKSFAKKGLTLKERRDAVAKKIKTLRAAVASKK